MGRNSSAAQDSGPWPPPSRGRSRPGPAAFWRAPCSPHWSKGHALGAGRVRLIGWPGPRQQKAGTPGPAIGRRTEVTSDLRDDRLQAPPRRPCRTRSEIRPLGRTPVLWCAPRSFITKSSHRLEIICRSHYDHCIGIMVNAESFCWSMYPPLLPGETQDLPVSRPRDDRTQEEAGALVTASSAPVRRTPRTPTAADQAPAATVFLSLGAPRSRAERSPRRRRYLQNLGFERRLAPSGRRALAGAIGRAMAAGSPPNTLEINGRELG
jgi:hypothetical protein